MLNLLNREEILIYNWHMKRSLKILTAIFAVIGAIVVIAIIGIILIINHNKNLVTISGPAMSPTLKSGQKVKLTRYAAPTNIQRGDIVEFAEQGHDSSKDLVLRIVGVPGDHLTISNDQVTIFNNQHPDGFNPDSAYLAGNDTTTGHTDIILDQSQYFVLGDNRSDSLDSRIFGPITSSQIIGKINQ